MTKANQIVQRVIQSLERHSIPYMLSGSYSSNAFGVARSTQDADFVIELGDRSINPVANDLLPDVRLDPQMRLESVTLTSRFIARDENSGFKIEFFLLSDDAHDRTRFERRKQQPFLDGTAFLPSPEDVVIQKVRWYGRAKRTKDLEDVKNVIAVQQDSLDLDYIRRWCDAHGTRELFERLYDEAKKYHI